MCKSSAPVLFLIFNRPENTKKVFEVIRSQRPAQLFIAADGPRTERAGEKDLCDSARKIIKQVDWKCEVKTLLREHNLGCKLAVSNAINWFFEWVEEGIILEDDCLPDQTFFPFCEELLEKYRFDEQVMSISGSNLLGRPWKQESQSYFRGHGGIWGWATWKRAWKRYDIDMKLWEDENVKKTVRNGIGSDSWFRFYSGMLDAAFRGTLDTWDIQWFYSILINDGVAVNPCVNLVKNIGFDSGTHMNTLNDPIAKLECEKMNFPLRHPQQLNLDKQYLELTFIQNHKRSGSVSDNFKAILKRFYLKLSK